MALLSYQRRNTTTTTTLQLRFLFLLIVIVWNHEPSIKIVTATGVTNHLLNSFGAARTQLQSAGSRRGRGTLGTTGRDGVVLSLLPSEHPPTILTYLRHRYWKPMVTTLTKGPTFQSSYKSPSFQTNISPRQHRHRLSLFPFDVLDPILEPIETLWEFYTARDDIRDEMLKRGAILLKKHSVRAIGFTLSAISIAEILTHSGIIQKERRNKFVNGVKQKTLSNRKLKQLSQKVVEEEAPIWIAHAMVKSFKAYRRLPEKTKFSISMSVGGVLAQTIINTSVAVTRLMIISFVTLESLAFMGVIGEPGESLMEWVDDHRDDIAAWEKKTIGFRQKMRLSLGADGWDGIGRVYQETVGEEKVAFAGLASGILLGMLL